MRLRPAYVKAALAAALLTAPGAAAGDSLSEAGERFSSPGANYRSYQRWYLEHSLVDLVVSGSEPAHLVRVLRAAQKLAAKQVLLRYVVVLGGRSYPLLDHSARKNADLAALYTRLAKELEISKIKLSTGGYAEVLAQMGITPELADAAEALALGEGRRLADPGQSCSALGIERSPTWIVTYRGKRYLYEGVESIADQFTSSGRFRYGLP